MFDKEELTSILDHFGFDYEVNSKNPGLLDSHGNFKSYKDIEDLSETLKREGVYK